MSATLPDGAERFTAYVAHELRTPLATQRALLELALADSETDAATWREIGADVLGACRQQERLLDTCLVLTRSWSGRQKCDSLDLAATASHVLRAHELSGLESVVALEPAWTTGDADLVERLVANLVSNAIRHNVAGGWIGVTSRAASGRAVLSVANTGPSIPRAELPRLFRPFQRLTACSRSSTDGVGLGLTIVQAVANAHAALVSAQPRPGGGLEIDVSFPAEPDRSERRRAPSRS
jgi:signal transduction histidine kinase